MIIIKFLTLIVTLIGAINWGLWGIAKYDLIADLFQNNNLVWGRICYVLIGLSGIFSLRLLFIGRNYTKKQQTTNEEAYGEQMEDDDKD